MTVAISRLLTLLALVLMPFGMNAAMAAPPMDHSSMAMAQHCGERSGQSGDMAAKHAADCTVACSALLATETAVAEPALAMRLPPAQPLMEIVTGFQPDIATPPPKFS
ncbi:MAG: hypothetical protein ABI422_03310 [Sphingomicrobium sp.]